jgi:hypothetical protein
VDQTKVYKLKLNRSFGHVSSANPVDTPTTAARPVLSRQNTQGCWQGQRPQLNNGQHTLDRLGAHQRNAVYAFELTLAKKFLQMAKHFKFVRPLSPTDFSCLVSKLIGSDPSRDSLVTPGGLSRSEAEAVLFATYASTDGKVHYQFLADALQRAIERSGDGEGGVDQSKQGVRNVWGAVVANQNSSSIITTSTSFTNPLRAKLGAVQNSLMASSAVADIFGAGFPVADVCTHWKVRAATVDPQIII